MLSFRERKKRTTAAENMIPRPLFVIAAVDFLSANFRLTAIRRTV